MFIMKYKLVIFDLDGTIIDSINGLSYSLNKVLKNNNFPIHTNTNVKTFIGNGIRNLVKNALPTTIHDDILIDKYFSEMNKIYSKYWDYKMCIFPGIQKLLDLLESKNIKLAINTNKDEETSKLITKSFFPKTNFSNIIGSNTLDTKKPDPKGIYHICKQLHINAKDCLYIGDSEVDYLTATNANVDFIAVNWGYRTQKNLIDAGAKIIVKNTKEIYNFIEKDIYESCSN